MAGEGSPTNPLINQARLLALLAGATISVGALTVTGNFSQSGTGTFATGTGAISLNGNVSITGSATLTISGQTAGRLLYTSTAGLVTSNSAALFDGTTLTSTFKTTTSSAIYGAGSDSVAGTAYLNWNNTGGAVALMQLSASNHLDFWSNPGAWSRSMRIQTDGTIIHYGATTLTGVVTASSATASTSTTTGALIVTGGLGVNGALYCTELNVKDTSNTSLIVRINGSATGNPQLRFEQNSTFRGLVGYDNGAASLYFNQFGNATRGLVVDSSNNVTVQDELIIASGKNIQLGNTYVGTPQVPTGYVTFKDATGTVYKLSCNV